MNAPSDIKSYMLKVGQRARLAAREVARADTNTKNRALIAASKALRRDAKKLISENAADVLSARTGGKDAAFIDRLTLTDKSIDAMAEGLEQVARLPDPVGQISELHRQPSGIKVGRMRVPLGVIGIIYESRPNVTADAFASRRATPASCAADRSRCARTWRSRRACTMASAPRSSPRPRCR